LAKSGEQQQDTHAALITKMETVGSKYLLISLLPEKPFSYQAGQYCLLHFGKGDKVFKRPYSIASAPRDDGLIEFCLIQTSEPDLAPIMGQLRVGDKLSMTAAQGRFPVPSINSQAVFIAGGSGIAPLRSMILDRVKADSSFAKTSLLFGCENEDIIPYKDEFDELSALHADFDVTYYAPQAIKQGITSGLVTADIESIESDKYFVLCGPPAMMDASKKLLKKKNVADDKILVDIY
jgi:ferredoxin-NADP reductase